MFRQTLFLQIPPELFSEPGFLNPSGDFIFATTSAVIGYGLRKGKVGYGLKRDVVIGRINLGELRASEKGFQKSCFLKPHLFLK